MCHIFMFELCESNNTTPRAMVNLTTQRAMTSETRFSTVTWMERVWWGDGVVGNTSQPLCPRLRSVPADTPPVPCYPFCRQDVRAGCTWTGSHHNLLTLEAVRLRSHSAGWLSEGCCTLLRLLSEKTTEMNFIVFMSLGGAPPQFREENNITSQH